MRKRAAMAAFLATAMLCAGTSAAQDTFTYYVHNERSDFDPTIFALKANGPDVAAVVISRAIMDSDATNPPTEISLWTGLPNTPAIRFVPSGTTFTFKLWMAKSASAGIIYPAVTMQLNGSGGAYAGAPPYGYTLCTQKGTTALTTTLTEYTLSCTSTMDIFVGSLDRLSVMPQWWVAQGPGNKKLNAEFGIEGNTSPSYPSRVIVTVPPNPRILSMAPVLGRAGTSVTIDGAHFGASGRLTFNGADVTPTSWTDTEIVAPAPAGGRAVVQVTSNSLASNLWTFISAWDDSVCQPQLSDERLGPVSESGGSLVLTVAAASGCNWTVGPPSDTWFSASPTSGTGPGSITVWVSSNTAVGAYPRAGTFSVNGVPVAVAQRSTNYGASYISLSPTPTIRFAQDQVQCSVTVSDDPYWPTLEGMDVYADGQLIGSTWGGGGTYGTYGLQYPLDVTASPLTSVRTFTCVVFSIPDGYVLARASLASPAPTLSSLTPASGRVDSGVVLSGTGFGPTQGSGSVTFNGVAAQIISWTDTQIQVIVPSTATTGPVIVTAGNGLASNAVTFTVTTASDPGGTLTFYHTDAIGSVRMITDLNGAVVSRYDYLPFGQDWSAVSLGDPNKLFFTGKERDRETGTSGWSPLDYFGARYYQNQFGRFARPDDPRYSNLSNPQSMNLFAYAYNNPMRWIDSTGHDPECPTDYCESVNVTAPLPPDVDIGLAQFVWISLFQNSPSTSNPPAQNPTMLVGTARCAAQFSNEHSMAAALQTMTGGAVDKDNIFVSALLGSDASTISNLFTGPRLQEVEPALVAKGISMAAKVVGNLPDPTATGLAALGTATIRETPGGTAFAASWTDATIATSLLGRTAGKALGLFTLGKGAWDASTYAYGWMQCR